MTLSEIVPFVKRGSLIRASNDFRFHERADHIFTRHKTERITSGRLSLLPCGMVVEPSPVRGLAADCPILTVFTVTFELVSSLRFGGKALRVFQQFNAFLLK